MYARSFYLSLISLSLGMGGNVVVLMSFVRGWNANITAQLAGEIPSTVTLTLLSMTLLLQRRRNLHAV